MLKLGARALPVPPVTPAPVSGAHYRYRAKPQLTLTPRSLLLRICNLQMEDDNYLKNKNMFKLAEPQTYYRVPFLFQFSSLLKNPKKFQTHSLERERKCSSSNPASFQATDRNPSIWKKNKTKTVGSYVGSFSVQRLAGFTSFPRPLSGPPIRMQMPVI